MMQAIIARTPLRRVGIAGRDGIIAAFAVLLIAGGTGWVVYRSAVHGLENEVKSNLLSLANSAAALTDGDGLAQITEPEDRGSTLYEAVRAPHTRLLEANPNIAYIYSIRIVDDRLYFITDDAVLAPGEVDDTSAVGLEYTDATAAMLQALTEQRSVVESSAYTDEWGTFLSAYAPVRDSAGDFVGIVGADIRLTQFQARVDAIGSSLRLGLVIALIASLLCGVAVWYVRRMAVRAQARRIADQAEFERLESERAERQRRSELDGLRRSEESHIAALEQLRAQQVEAVTSEAERRRRADLHHLADALDVSIQGVLAEVDASVGRMQLSASSVTQVADDMIERADRVAQVANDTVTLSAQGTAARVLSDSIDAIRAQTRHSNDVAALAVQRVEQARAAIGTLAATSSGVGDIVGFINGIAGQIRLLALNATIEAARAGESGKGFAVVANEVRDLAKQVNGATDEIARQIEEIQGATQVSVDDVLQVAATIEDVSGSIRLMAEAVDGQASASAEIARIITLSVRGADDISTTIDAVHTGAEHTGRSAADVMHATGQLDDQARLLQRTFADFLVTVRSS